MRHVKAAFSLAAKLAPCVLFVDEVRLQEAILPTARCTPQQAWIALSTGVLLRSSRSGPVWQPLQVMPTQELADLRFQLQAARGAPAEAGAEAVAVWHFQPLPDLGCACLGACPG